MSLNTAIKDMQENYVLKEDLENIGLKYYTHFGYGSVFEDKEKFYLTKDYNTGRQEKIYNVDIIINKD